MGGKPSGERRVIGNAVVEIEPAKPPKSQMQFDFLAQPPLKADAIAVAHDQHPDHKLWINRRPADLAVEGCQLLTKSSQQPRHHRIDPAQQMTSRNALFEVEQVEQLALIARLPTHHGKPPPPIALSRRNHCSLMSASPFSTLSARSCREHSQQGFPLFDHFVGAIGRSSSELIFA